MRILLLTPQLPYPPHQGTAIRNYNLLKYLARHHTVDLLSFLAPGDRLEPNSPLYALCRRIQALPQPVRSLSQRAFDTLTSSRPDMALRLESEQMHRQILEWIEDTDYDIVQIEGIELAQYGLKRRKATQSDAAAPSFVFDDHNCEYLLQHRNALTDLRRPRRWIAATYSLVQWRKLRSYESAVCRHADAVLAVSTPDQNALLAIAPNIAVTVVSNGIDLDDYPASDRGMSPSPPTLLFTGKMDYRPNIDAVLWFGQKVLPLVLEQVPSAVFQIVGMNPHPRLDTLRPHPNIEITGTVPDIRPYLKRAAVYVIPMRVGGGTRLKALEAMAAARPIVSTTLGVEGIPVTNGRELLLADTPGEFARSVLLYLKDQRGAGGMSESMGEAARHFVVANFTWDRILPRLDEVYDNLHPTPGMG